MARHPLARLRESIGLSHPAYAQLVAETHAALGHGHMADRREKVSRWESGRTAPQLTAQFAIAHIHRVPEEDVRRLGWPHWLHLATDDSALLALPWNPNGAVEALCDIERRIGSEIGSYLIVTGPVRPKLVRELLAAVAHPESLPVRDGHRVTAEVAADIAARVDVLEELVPVVSPVNLYPAAVGEFRLVTRILADGGYEQKAGAGLLHIASRTAGLCGLLQLARGLNSRAERCYLAAARAATAAGDRLLASAQTAGLAYSHIATGDLRDVFPLIDAARKMPQLPSPSLVVLLHVLEAQAHALRSEVTDSVRALDRAAGALAAIRADEDPVAIRYLRDIDEEWLATASGRTWFHLGRPQQALAHLAHLVNDDAVSRLRRPFPFAAENMLFVVDAQLALKELDAAVCSAHRAVTHFGRTPSSISRQFQKRFAVHRTVPVVREFLDLLRLY